MTEVEEPTLFDDMPGLVSWKHPDTSIEAADLVTLRSGTQRRRVWDFIHRAGSAGVTDLDIQEGLHMSGDTERPRRVELVDAGLVVDSGERRVEYGRTRIVWKVVR